MATYVELPQVKTWYDERGEGEPLVLLHGGVVDARFFDPNIDALAARFHVVALHLRGHDQTPDVDGPFTYVALAQDTIDFIDAVVGGPAHLVGHSVGAGAALHAALRDLVCRDQAIVVERPADEDQAADKVRGDLRGVGALTLVMASDDDIITLEHTLALYRVIKDSELAVVPGTSHFLTQEKPDLCNGTVVDFLASDPLATVAPMRRVPSGSAA